MRSVSLECSLLKLSPPNANDIEAIARACQDPSIPKWTGSVPSPYSEEDALDFVESYSREGWDRGTSLTWAIHVKDEAQTGGEDGLMVVPANTEDQSAGHEYCGGFAGIIGLDKVTDHSAEIGYWLAPEARGQGYMRRACTLVLDFAFTGADEDASSRSGRNTGGLGLHRIAWLAMVGNESSAAVARELGFRYEGRVRDALKARDGRVTDYWLAGLLATDARKPVEWPDDVLKKSSKEVN